MRSGFGRLGSFGGSHGGIAGFGVGAGGWRMQAQAQPATFAATIAMKISGVLAAQAQPATVAITGVTSGADTTAPALLDVATNAAGNKIILTFSETLDT